MKEQEKLQIYVSPEAEILEMQTQTIMESSAETDSAPGMSSGWSINY